MARKSARSSSDTASSPEANTAGYDFSEQVGHLLRRAYQRHVAIFQQTIPDSQLTAVQFVVLCALLKNGPCSLNDLVRATAVDQGTARGVVERLKARGLIHVAPDADDRRKVFIRVTKAGESIAVRTIPFAEAITETTLADLNPAERVAVLYLLRKMSGPVDAGT